MNRIEAMQAIGTLDELRALGEIAKGVSDTLNYAEMDEGRADEDALRGIGGILCFAANQLAGVQETMDEEMGESIYPETSDEAGLVQDAIYDMSGLGQLFKCAATGDFKDLDTLPFTMAAGVVSNIAENISKVVSTLKSRLPKLKGVKIA